jgi:hypothetical protein
LGCQIQAFGGGLLKGKQVSCLVICELRDKEIPSVHPPSREAAARQELQHQEKLQTKLQFAREYSANYQFSREMDYFGCAAGVQHDGLDPEFSFARIC